MQILSRKREILTARIRSGTDTVDVEFGNRVFSLRGERLGIDQRQHADFAAYGLAAIAMTHNLEIRIDHAVTKTALDRLGELGQTWLRWAPGKVFPLRIAATETMDDDLQKHSGGILCMSGGVDSTFAALNARAEGVTHGLLIAGADYLDADGPGFTDLRQRVQQIARLLDLQLATVETDIKRHGIRWGFFHPLVLTMCLRFTGAGLGFGAYAADVTHAEEFLAHPWGNNHVVARLMGTADFPVRYLGAETGRSAKVRAIAGHAHLLQFLSVCYSDTSFGGNCGTCEKCIRTRCNLATASIAHEGLFREQFDLARHLRRLRVPLNRTIRAQHARRFGDIYFDLPEGELRQAVGAYLERILRPRGGLQ